jgi:DNA (cytosine-5)-methyltransferase 1
MIKKLSAWPTLDDLAPYIDPTLREFIVVDLFCGCGGASQGTLLALELGITAESLRQRGWRLRLINVNHWELAIETIKANICFAEMFNASVENVDPDFTLGGQRPHLLIAAAECIQYSVARGNKPIRDQSRTTAAWVLDWVKTKPHSIYFENVPLWSTWGPLGDDNRPIKETEGIYYEAFLRDVRNEGYTITQQVVNCAEYGDATTRERLFILGMSEEYHYNGTLPSPTHTEFPERYPNRKPFVAAREIIDWNRKGEPITHRKRGLHAVPTLRRVRGGYVKQKTILSPVLVTLIDRLIPIATTFHETLLGRFSAKTMERKLTKEETKHNAALVARARAASSAEVEKVYATPLASLRSEDLSPEQNATLAVLLGQHGGAVARTDNQPLPTIAGSGAIGLARVALADGMLVRANASETSCFNDAIQSLDKPVGTVVTKDCRALAEPTLAIVQHGENDERHADINRPMHTLTGKGSTILTQPALGNPGALKAELAQPFIAQIYGSNIEAGGTDSVEDPLSTVVAGGKHHALAEPVIATVYGQRDGKENDDGRCETTDKTLGTIVAGGKHHALAEPIISSHHATRHGEDRTRTLDKPLSTIVGGGGGYLALPFIVPNFGERENQLPRVHAIDAPVPTITSHGAGAVIDVALPNNGPYFLYDGLPVHINILYRMLHSSELAAAHSIGHIRFVGSETAAVKMVGNSIPAKTAAAMIGHVLLPVLAQSTQILELAA